MIKTPIAQCAALALMAALSLSACGTLPALRGVTRRRPTLRAEMGRALITLATACGVTHLISMPSSTNAARQSSIVTTGRSNGCSRRSKRPTNACSIGDRLASTIKRLALLSGGNACGLNFDTSTAAKIARSTPAPRVP